MAKQFRWLALGAAAIGSALAFVVTLMPGKRAAANSSDTLNLLRYLAKTASSPVPELSRRTKVAPDDMLVLLTALEEQGLVQLSKDGGSASVRIVAITQAGREFAK